MKREDVLRLKYDFYKLRAIDGKSFDQISVLLGVSKPTLIKWEKGSKVTLDQIRASEVHNLISQYSFDLKSRLQELLELSKLVSKELFKKNLSIMPTNRLFDMYLHLNAQIEKIEANSPITINDELSFETDKYFTETLPDNYHPEHLVAMDN